MVYQGPNRGGREVEGRGGRGRGGGVLPFLGFRWVPMMKQGKSLGSDDKAVALQNRYDIVANYSFNSAKLISKFGGGRPRSALYAAACQDRLRCQHSPNCFGEIFGEILG